MKRIAHKDQRCSNDAHVEAVEYAAQAGDEGNTPEERLIDPRSAPHCLIGDDHSVCTIRE